MQKNIVLLSLTLLLVACLLLPVHAKETRGAKTQRQVAIQMLFAQLQKGLKQKNESLFQKQWASAGWKRNLVGGSGIPGHVVYKQGSRKRWYLKLDLNSIKMLTPHKAIVVCFIWSWRKKRPVDKVHAFIIKTHKRWLIVGAGEKRKQVKALAKRYPTTPPPRRAP